MTDTVIDTLIDTNILVYAHSNQDVNKRKISIAKLKTLKTEGRGVLSTQILSELYNALRRQLRKTLENEKEAKITARTVTEEYSTLFKVLIISVNDVIAASHAVEHHSLSYWDALIWATAKSNGIKTILTEDGPSGATIDGVKFLNPFKDE